MYTSTSFVKKREFDSGFGFWFSQFCLTFRKINFEHATYCGERPKLNSMLVGSRALHTLNVTTYEKKSILTKFKQALNPSLSLI